VSARSFIVSALAVFILVGCGSTFTRSPAQRPPAAAATLGAGFVSKTAPVNGTTLHCVRGGQGPPRIYPRAVRGVMIVETPLPGFAQSDDINSRLWHVGFQQMSSLPEKLIAGRQAIYFREAFFDTGTLKKKAVSDADVARYAESYAAPGEVAGGVRVLSRSSHFSSSRRQGITGRFLYYMSRVWTYVYFIPAIFRLMELPPESPLSADLASQIAHWVNLSWIRCAVDGALALLLLFAALRPPARTLAIRSLLT
jgi:hypothetical protein